MTTSSSPLTLYCTVLPITLMLTERAANNHHHWNHRRNHQWNHHRNHHLRRCNFFAPHGSTLDWFSCLRQTTFKVRDQSALNLARRIFHVGICRRTRGRNGTVYSSRRMISWEGSADRDQLSRSSGESLPAPCSACVKATDVCRCLAKKR
jgi:hypothetical protein